MSQAIASMNARGVIALELSAGRAPAHAALPHALAAELAEKVGRDLAQLVPAVRELELSLAGAHFDPAEVLRPGWPMHRRLDELRARAPGRDAGPRLLAFGADADGSVPLPFQADTALLGGALRVVPFLLSGPAETLQPVAEALEDLLLAQGMAQPDTALLAQQAFGAQIEHARYLTVNDLAAMMSMQYDNQGLAPLWPLIETALLAPDQEEWLASPPEPLLRYRGGEVRMALFDPAGWCAYYAHDRQDCERLQRVYEHYLARQRQLAAVLEAHGMPVLYVHCEAGQDARQALRAA
ncbi:hypothetical protein [Xanthomonas graminis]|jgi:hypothetical protein|uniref:Uncharacterized protein n=2 Tax=Xanthomonas translucens group TaxID=3390202 RepID=A0A1M4ISH2_9XANT|nr:hypothetical protein [Xanthomonas translucens]OAX58683.1 hypothetical protein A6R72_04180 [Xanthomonas translucens pv. graminis]UKE54356.1 hypothetical protein KFS84_20070 [Xanthomonas translucens pv. graminis]WIH08826.1 hypothetical protein KM579_00735 [Xanthomonas translucens pv. graminis]WIH12263.1 hypothetical protein KM563_20185 [Xanthomonas translucens pv. graminis]WIH15934.1 hypothetical protein KM433_20045 [Xanthomonas translucens pv. graminis]